MSQVLLANMPAQDFAGMETRLPFVLFRVSDNVYGVSSKDVHSIEVYHQHLQVADNPEFVLGVVEFRGAYVPLVGLRKLFRMDAQMDEMKSRINIRQRMTDHEVWVDTLEKSVRERRPFTLTDDPHQCAFGRWFDGFKTDNNEMNMLLRKVDAPHQAIHQTAKLVKKLVSEGKFDEALEAVLEMKQTHFVQTMQLLSSIEASYQKGLQEMMVVVDNGEGPCALLVDSILSVEELEQFQRPDAAMQSKYMLGIARRKKEKDMVVLFNCQMLQNQKLRIAAEQAALKKAEAEATVRIQAEKPMASFEDIIEKIKDELPLGEQQAAEPETGLQIELPDQPQAALDM